ncbi:hypothetical protein [Paenibacillus sp. HGF5]|uniref:hypothetical protein n=1 Tax=Paenibacillus sp. HGF5 TaxID=908341 RepID=UPI0034A0C02D
MELLAIPIKNSSRPGNTVANFFGGSRSTLTTCANWTGPAVLWRVIRSSATSVKIGTRNLPA